MPLNGPATDPPLRLKAYLAEWYSSYAPILAKRRPYWRDDVWEYGVLELVSPLEPARRWQAKGLRVGLPWGGRLDLELYWRILYAAFAETLRSEARLKPLEEDPSAMVRTAVTGSLVALERSKERLPAPEDQRVLAYVDQTLGQAFYRDIISRAAHDIRLRSGLAAPPRPVPPASRVMIGRVPALVAGYTGGGLVRISRETAPDDPDGIDWRLDPASGRYEARVMPWLLTPQDP
jgi:hypothetical protein